MTSSRSPTCQIYPEASEEQRIQSYLASRTPVPRSTSIDERPMFEGLEGGIHIDQHQYAADGSRRDSQVLYEHLRVSREDGDDDEYSMRSPPEPWVAMSPQGLQNIYPCSCSSPHRFISSEAVHDAVRRVVQALSEVFADPELDHFLNNLNDTELDDLLSDPGKLTEVCDTTLEKYTEEVFRARESFGLHPARLVEIVS